MDHKWLKLDLSVTMSIMVVCVRIHVAVVDCQIAPYSPGLTVVMQSKTALNGSNSLQERYVDGSRSDHTKYFNAGITCSIA